MHRRKNRHLFNADFLEALGGRESRLRSPERGSSRRDHKALHLCRAAQRALSLALSGECGDDVLRSLCVHDVVPAPDASRLLVRLISPPSAGQIDDVYARLERVRPLLRRTVAQAVTRKRAPELSFVVMPQVPHE